MCCSRGSNAEGAGWPNEHGITYLAGSNHAPPENVVHQGALRRANASEEPKGTVATHWCAEFMS
jgi:hypothetical protein